MSYCANKAKAIIRYSFANKKETFETNSTPVEVVVGLAEDAATVNLEFYQSFPGSAKGSFSFTVNAPSEVPRNLSTPPEIYLLSGVWDDNGSVGTYNTGGGIVKEYQGNPLKIGEGYSIGGTVINVLPTECFARVLLQWRFGKCKITISHLGKVLFQDTGLCPVKFNVSCDEDCPEGTIKCKSSSYPGYCCLPCEIKSEIANVTAMVRSLNG